MNWPALKNLSVLLTVLNAIFACYWLYEFAVGGGLPNLGAAIVLGSCAVVTACAAEEYRCYSTESSKRPAK